MRPLNGGVSRSTACFDVVAFVSSAAITSSRATAIRDTTLGSDESGDTSASSGSTINTLSPARGEEPRTIGGVGTWERAAGSTQPKQ